MANEEPFALGTECVTLQTLRGFPLTCNSGALCGQGFTDHNEIGVTDPEKRMRNELYNEWKKEADLASRATRGQSGGGTITIAHEHAAAVAKELIRR